MGVERAFEVERKKEGGGRGGFVRFRKLDVCVNCACGDR